MTPPKVGLTTEKSPTWLPVFARCERMMDGGTGTTAYFRSDSVFGNNGRCARVNTIFDLSQSIHTGSIYAEGFERSGTTTASSITLEAVGEADGKLVGIFGVKGTSSEAKVGEKIGSTTWTVKSLTDTSATLTSGSSTVTRSLGDTATTSSTSSTSSSCAHVTHWQFVVSLG